jgi:hypothetical protein
VAKKIVGLEKPEGLSLPGTRAHKAIVDFLKKEGLGNTGAGSHGVFYSPSEWRQRGEEYGCNALLIVTYDGGDHRHAMTLDSECYALNERFQDALQKVDCFFEECTTWYGAVYPA